MTLIFIETSIQKSEDNLNIVQSMDMQKLDISEDQTYRERMILMNRIDIYRLFITVIIISGEIKYPRALTSVEERELKVFIEQLNEFENMVLDLNINESIIWEKGKNWVFYSWICNLFITDYWKLVHLNGRIIS